MSEIYDRIISLVKILGLGTEPYSSELAELKGYAAGLDLIMEDMERTEGNLSPMTADEYSLKLFCNQLGIGENMSDDERRALICERLAECFGDYDENAMIAQFAQYGINCEYYIKSISLECESFTEMNAIENMGRILKNYQSPTSFIITYGVGLDYNYWDSLEYSFDAYERLDLQFYILDSLK